MESFKEVQVWLFPAVYLFLIIFCLVKIRSSGRKIPALAFGALILSTLSWPLLNWLEIGMYDAYAYDELLNIGDLLLFLMFAGLMAAGITHISKNGGGDFRKDKPGEATLPYNPLRQSGALAEVIDIRPLRIKGERVMIGILSLISAANLLFFFILGLQMPSLFLTLGAMIGTLILLLYFAARLFRGRILGNAIRVTRKQFPEINEIKLDIMRRLNFVYETEIYVVEEGSFNAFLSKFIATRFIILNSGLVNAMLTEKNWKELEFIIGRALGHLKAKHFQFWLLQDLISMGKFNPLLYFAYERMCHYTSDRIGLVVCGDPQAAIRALIKLTVGDKLQGNVHLENIKLQYIEVKSSFGAIFSEWFLKHPHLIKRIYQIAEFGTECAMADGHIREERSLHASRQVEKEAPPLVEPSG